MKVIKPSYEIRKLDLDDISIIEEAARICYKSESAIKEGSAEKIIALLMDRGHESAIEHSRITVKFIVDRGVSHEMVRHRLASYSQESTRFCNYSQDKFGNEITVIEPCFYKERNEQDIHHSDDHPFLQANSDSSDITKRYVLWYNSCLIAESRYFQLLEIGATPQEARAVLPNSLKTEIYVTANFREWRNILKLRTAKDAHPQIREVMIPLLRELQQKVPVIFNDIGGDIT